VICWLVFAASLLLVLSTVHSTHAMRLFCFSSPDDLATPRPSGTLGLDSAAATVAGIEAIERMTQSQRDHEAEQRKHELEVLDKKIELETAKKASAKKPRVSANNIRKVDRKLDVDSSDEEDDGDYAKATSIINNNGNDSDEDEITASDTDDDEDEDPPTSTASNSSDFVVGDKIKWTKSVQCTIVRVNKKSYRVTYTNPWTGENQKDSFALKGKYEKHSTVLVKFTSRGVITSVADDEIGLDITCNNEAIETYAQKAEWHEIVKIVPPPAPPSNAKRISQWQRKPTHYS